MSKNRTENWSDIQERSTYIGLRFLLWLYNIAGIRALHALLYFVVGFYFITNSRARRASRQYLTRLHTFMRSQSPWKQKPNLWHSFRHFMAFARAVTDKIIVWLGHYRLDDLSFFGYDAYEQARDAGKGVILISSHLGNVELCSAIAGSVKNMPLTILAHSKNAPNFKRILAKVTGKQDHIEMIEVTAITPAIAVRLQEKVTAGGTIVIAGDRTAIKSQLRYEVTSFLGHDAAFAQGPFILAGLLDCPVFFLFSMKQEQSYHVHFEKYANSLKSPRKDRAGMLKAHIQHYVKRLEHYACAYPLQWFNFYDYWALPNKEDNKESP